MADETRNDIEEQRADRPRRTTLTGRRFGASKISFGEEVVELPPESAAAASPRRDTTERRRAS